MISPGEDDCGGKKRVGRERARTEVRCPLAAAPFTPSTPPAPPLLRACAVRCVEVCARACAKMGGQTGRKRESKRDERERERLPPNAFAVPPRRLRPLRAY